MVVAKRLRTSPVVGLIAIFAIARLIVLASGMSFDADNLTGWMQIVDVGLLRHDLWRNLYYLHSQPPLFNLIIGLALRLGDHGFIWAMWLLYALVALGGILSFHAVARDLIDRPRLVFAISAWFCIAPSVLLFSQKLYYDGLVPWLLSMAVWGWHSGVKHRSFARLLFGFSMLAATLLIRTMIHPLLLVCALAVLLLLVPGQRKRVIAAAIVPALAVLAVILKNFMLFGITQLSSWAPLSPGQTTVDQLPVETRIQLMKEGRLSRFAPLIVFALPSQYLALMPPLKPTGLPMLDDPFKSTGDPNYHHILFTKIGAERSRDVMFALRYAPERFGLVVVKSLYHFHRPASEFKGMERNLAHIAIWDRIGNATVGLQPAAWFGSSLDKGRPQAVLLQISYSTLATTLAFLGGVWLVMRSIFRDIRARRWPEQALATPLIVIGFGLFVLLLSSAFDVYENNRAHYDIGPILALGALWFLAQLRRQGPLTR